MALATSPTKLGVVLYVAVDLILSASVSTAVLVRIALDGSMGIGAVYANANSVTSAVRLSQGRRLKAIRSLRLTVVLRCNS